MAPNALLSQTPADAEARLVAAAVAGDDRAFAELADRHRAVLLAHCRRILGAGPDAEDAVQEVLVRAWRRRGGFEGRSSFRWWLLRIATNTCTDIGRRTTRAPVPRRFDGDDPGAEPPADAARTDPAALAASRTAIEDAYLVVVRTLPARQRAVLVLREVLGYSAADTAALLDTTVAAVNSTLQRARAALDRRRGAGSGPSPARTVTSAERDLVRRLVDAHARADAAALVAMLGRAAA